MRLMDEDLRGLAGMMIQKRSDRYDGARLCINLKVSRRRL